MVNSRRCLTRLDFRKQIVQGTESITSLIAATEKLHQRRLTTVLEKYQALSQ